MENPRRILCSNLWPKPGKRHVPSGTGDVVIIYAMKWAHDPVGFTLLWERWRLFRWVFWLYAAHGLSGFFHR
jgi:hypothetical protein